MPEDAGQLPVRDPLNFLQSGATIPMHDCTGFSDGIGLEDAVLDSVLLSADVVGLEDADELSVDDTSIEELLPEDALDDEELSTLVEAVELSEDATEAVEEGEEEGEKEGEEEDVELFDDDVNVAIVDARRELDELTTLQFPVITELARKRSVTWTFSAYHSLSGKSSHRSSLPLLAKPTTTTSSSPYLYWSRSTSTGSSSCPTASPGTYARRTTVHNERSWR
jgi:hypothetical protein